MMTTKSDWEFREAYLRDAADGLDKDATALRERADWYRGLANRAHIEALHIGNQDEKT